MSHISITEEKRQKIKEEGLRKGSLTVEDILGLIRNDEITEARHVLIFHMNPSVFAERFDRILGCLEQDFETADRETRRRFFIFLAKFTLDLLSFLPHWNLKNKESHGQDALADADIEKYVARNRQLLASWCDREQGLSQDILRDWLKETEGRLKVEGVSDENESEKLAAKLVGSSILEYIDNTVDSFKRSNLRKICELRVLRQTQTEIGNDHTTNLEYAMWLGASFVTTNPQLVEITWELNPEFWSHRADEIIRSRYSMEETGRMMRTDSEEEIESVVEQINTDITMEVVLLNAKLLRGIFLLSDGKRGLVCCQVNPLKHSDVDAMVREALYIYSSLIERFGGVPNVVFKLPATKAGLEASKDLTSRGIGVTITVSFGLFQALPFGEVIGKGHAIVSYLVVMNGRLADPIINELKKLGEEYARAGRWAGVAVAKRLYQKLYASPGEEGKGYDSKRIRIIVASLRNYEGSFLDITEVIGVPIITVFPNIRRAFDAQERKINPKAIEEPIDEAVLEWLLRSELFRQAYWTLDDDDDLKPTAPFSLEDQTQVLEYPPVKNTLGQFCKYYIKLGELVRSHISKSVH